MRRYKKPVFLLWILCVLLFGMCLDSIGADSYSAYSSSCEGSAASLHAQHRNSPVEQAYAPKAQGTGEAALAPCQAMRRSPSRAGRSLILAALWEDSFSARVASVHSTVFPVDFHEITSNTVIISYIHRQDGAKA